MYALDVIKCSHSIFVPFYAEIYANMVLDQARTIKWCPSTIVLCLDTGLNHALTGYLYIDFFFLHRTAKFTQKSNFSLELTNYNTVLTAFYQGCQTE